MQQCEVAPLIDFSHKIGMKVYIQLIDLIGCSVDYIAYIASPMITIDVDVESPVNPSDQTTSRSEHV